MSNEKSEAESISPAVQSADQTPVEEQAKVVEGTTPKVQWRDTTSENLGKSFAIVGGVRNPATRPKPE